MDGIQQSIIDFPFYTLKQCSHQQLLSHSKYPINIYHRKQTQQVFLVKEIPFSEKIIKLYRILKSHQTLNIVPARGLSLLKCGNQLNRPNQMYLLLWMEKLQMSLPEYIEERRKRRLSFTVQQVKDFIFQIITTMSILQSKGICHRDIKPQNILYHKGRYFLCDFDEVILTKQGKTDKSLQQIMSQIQYTTILYSTPKFLKALKKSTFREKYFDPYKMDVYSFGLTLLYFCSMGRFCIDDRHIYIYSEDGSHKQFINEERRKYVKKDSELKVFSNILKLMLEEDQYKRDDFITLNMKIKNLIGVEDQSENSYSEYSKNKKKQTREKLRKSHGKGFIWGKYKKSQKFLLTVFVISFLIYMFLLIF